MNDKLKFPADEERQIDDLFRKNLGDHTVEPSDNTWKGVSRRLLWKEISRFNFTNLSRGYYVAGSVAVAVIIGILFFYPGKKSSMQLNPVQYQTDVSSATSGDISATKEASRDLKTVSSAGMNSGDTRSGIPASTGTSPSSTQPKTRVVQESPATHFTRTQKPVMVQGIAAVSRPAPNSVSAPSEPYPLFTTASTDRWSLSSLKSLDVSELYITDPADTVISFRTINGIMNVQKQKPGMVQSFSTDFGITPEWISYKTTHTYSEMNYWLNANLSYHFSKFTIQTGVALGYVFDEGKYYTKYLSKDSIGYFTSVISFYVDPENQNELIFNTKNVAVYDSLQHFADDRTRNRYTYLEIPLRFGYRIFETNRLSLDILAGPALTILIGTKEAAPYVDFPNARIIRIDDNTPERVKMNWKISLGLHLEYQVTKNLGCYLEPSYKYYFNSFTKNEQTSSRDPFSIGVGLGIRYHFGQIKK